VFNDTWFHRTAETTLRSVPIPMPDVRETAYFYKLADEDHVFYVSQSAHKFAYETMHLFRGGFASHEQRCTLREVKVHNVTRYRDGGTTFVYAQEGILFVPRRGSNGFHGKKQTTWTEGVLSEDLRIPRELPGIPLLLVELDDNLFTFDEALVDTPNYGAVTITRRP